MKAKQIPNLPPYLKKQVDEYIDREVAKRVPIAAMNTVTNVDAAVLYTMRRTLGFGKKRLERFYKEFTVEIEALKNHYEMPEDVPFLCKEKLKEIGVDLDELRKL